MLDFLKIRMKAMKEAIYLKTLLKANHRIGLTPPVIINGKRFFFPSLFDLYKEELRQERKYIEYVKQLERIVRGEEDGDKRLATIALCLETKKGRSMLVDAMVLPIMKTVNS